MTEEVSLLRLYVMRGMYLLNCVLVGSGVCYEFIHREKPWDQMVGVAFSFFAALSVLSALGIRYPTAGTGLTGGGTSGSVKLNVDTTKIPQLGSVNSFTQTQAVSASSTTQVLKVTQSGTAASGDAIHGVTSSPGGSGVFGEGAIGIQGLANPSTGLAGLFRGTVKTTGNGNNILAGDPGCGSGFAGVGFTTGKLSSCTNYALLGGSKGDTFINSSGTAKMVVLEYGAMRD